MSTERTPDQSVTEPTLDQRVWAGLKKTLGPDFWIDVVRDGAKAALVATGLLIAGIIAKSTEDKLWWLGVGITVVFLAGGLLSLYRGRANAGPNPLRTYITLGMLGIFIVVAIVLFIAYVFVELIP